MSTVRKSTFMSDATGVMTAIFWNSVDQEFQVRQKVGAGKWIEAVTYFTTDPQDAHSTALRMHSDSVNAAIQHNKGNLA